MPHLKKLIARMMAILLTAAILPFNLNQAGAQGGIDVTAATAVVDFGRTITFQATITAPIGIQQVSLLFRGMNEDVTRVEPVQLGPDGFVSFTYDASRNFFPPFSSVVFWFQATLADNQTYTSQPITFAYNDNRFPWREAKRDNLVVHWYAGDDAFGAAALDAANRGILSINEFIPISSSQPIDIYIYSNALDLQNTLLLGGQEWVGGHANPELGVVLVAISPGVNQSIELETMIPHELAHVMLYRSLGGTYNIQPLWLLEGIATMAEYPNPDYKHALDIASGNNTLLSFADLCVSFPADAGNAYLAYAQSQSFVTYIRETYGTSGLARLTKSYSEGFNCELGATNALGTPLSLLDVRWRESVLGQNVAGVAFRNLSPYLLLMALVLVVPLWGAIDMLRQRRKRAKQSD